MEKWDSDLDDLGFCLFHQISNDQLSEDRDVPEVDEEEAEVAGEEEGEGEDAEVEEGLVVHPGNNGHPDCKGRQVDPCIQLELFRGTIDASNNVDDPGLVEHRVHLSDEAEDRKSNGLASEERSSEAEDDEDVVGEKLAGLLVPHHVDGLGQVDPDGEGDEALCGRRRGEHQVVPHLGAGVESCNSPSSSDGCGNSCEVSVLPLPVPRGRGEDRSRGWRQEDETSKEVEQESDKEPRSRRG